MSTYYHDFMLAVDRSRRFGLEVPQGALTRGQLLNTQGKAILSTVLAAAFDTASPFEVAANPNRWHEYLAPIIGDALRCEVFPTIGYVELDGLPGLAGIGVHDEQMLKEGLGKPEATQAVHSWLTLPTMEIIDVALLSKIADSTGNDELLGELLNGHPDSFQGVRCVPTLVGFEYVCRSRTA